MRYYYIYLGRIKWARSLKSHLEELITSVTSHHILKNLPATQELSRRYNQAEQTLKSYETDMVAVWMNQQVSWKISNSKYEV